MNWLTRTISKVFPRKKKSLDIAENAWIKCSQCQTMLYSSDLEKTLFVCPNCDEHLQIHPRIRFKNLFDGGVFEEIKYPSGFTDPLNFKALTMLVKKQTWMTVFLLVTGKLIISM